MEGSASEHGQGFLHLRGESSVGKTGLLSFWVFIRAVSPRAMHSEFALNLLDIIII